MNKQLRDFARKTLKENLALCSDGEVHRFKLMYSPKNVELDFRKVVDAMPKEKLDWAMQQVQRTLDQRKNLVFIGSEDSKCPYCHEFDCRCADYDRYEGGRI